MRFNPSAAWRKDHPWAKAYDFIVDNDRVGQVIWRVGMGSDLGVLHRTAADEIARLSDGAMVLDLPCGGGVALSDLPSGLDVTYIAADISPAMLERTRDNAREQGRTIVTAQEDVQNLGFDDDAFDLVLSFTSLHCFPDPEDAVAELTRVIKPGGRIAGSAMLKGGPPWHAATWIGGTAMGVLGPGCTRDELQTWLTEGQMENVQFTASGAITYFTATKAG